MKCKQTAITSDDIRAYLTGTKTAIELAVRYNLSLSTLYKRLPSKTPGKHNLTRTVDRQALREALKQSVPYSKTNGSSAVLKAFGLPSLRHALSILKVNSLDELRADNLYSRKLKAHGLRLRGNILYPIGLYTRIHAPLTDEDLRAIKANPDGWIENHQHRINLLKSEVRKYEQTQTA